MYPDYVDEGTEYLQKTGSFNFARPYSAPPSPSSSREYPLGVFVGSIKWKSFHSLGHTTPAPSVHGSDEEDDVDEDQELHELGLSKTQG